MLRVPRDLARRRSHCARIVSSWPRPSSIRMHPIRMWCTAGARLWVMTKK
ncbi:MAG: hypothetical protein OER88_14635 [Planctomycetota bacterium]|nr:hypothetical protein [Planctomycetota bacterium]